MNTVYLRACTNKNNVKLNRWSLHITRMTKPIDINIGVSEFKPDEKLVGEVYEQIMFMNKGNGSCILLSTALRKRRSKCYVGTRR